MTCILTAIRSIICVQYVSWSRDKAWEQTCQENGLGQIGPQATDFRLRMFVNHDHLCKLCWLWMLVRDRLQSRTTVLWGSGNMEAFRSHRTCSHTQHYTQNTKSQLLVYVCNQWELRHWSQIIRKKSQCLCFTNPNISAYQANYELKQCWRWLVTLNLSVLKSWTFVN